MGAKITLNGNLGDDPRHGVTKNRLGEDLHWVSFSMRQPHWLREKEEVVDKGGFWINVSWFSRKAEVAATLLKKGAAVIVSGDLHVEYWTDQETGELRSGFKVNADEVSLDMRALSSVAYRNRSFQGPQPQPNVGKTDGQRLQGGGPQQRNDQEHDPATAAPYDDHGFDADVPPEYLNEAPPQGEIDNPVNTAADNPRSSGKSSGKSKKSAAKSQTNVPDDDFPV